MKRHPAQKFALISAIICYIAAFACIIAAVLHQSDAPGDPVRASLMASVVFFAGCGVVLQVIGTARLKGILSGGSEPPPNQGS